MCSVFRRHAFLIAAQNPDPSIITIPPQNIVGCYGRISTFYCGSNRTDTIRIFWIVLKNGTTLNDYEMKVRKILPAEYTTGSDFTTLSILGLPINDNLLIICNMITNDSTADTASATFNVAPALPPIKDLNVRFEENLMICSWTPPDCLPQNYTYVLVSNDTVTVSTSNTTEPEYTMQNVSSCTNYTVSVTVIDTGSTEEYESVPTTVIEQNDFLGGWYNIITCDFVSKKKEPIGRQSVYKKFV